MVFSFNRHIQALAAVVFTLVSSQLSAQTVKISIADAQFTKPLIEKLVGEYHKANPSFNAEIVSTAEGSLADVSITDSESNDQSVVARYVLLPVANVNSALLTDKKFQKGLNSKLAKELFVQKSVEEQIDNPDAKKLPATVYALSGSRSVTTNLLARSLNVTAKDIAGKKILGKEENAIAVVQKREDAVSVSIPSLIYDSSSRKPVDGLTVLPVDLDGNDKVTDAERAAVADIDALTAYIASSANSSLPVGDIRISTDNKYVQKFVSWVATQGQDYLKEFGYLKASDRLTAQK